MHRFYVIIGIVGFWLVVILGRCVVPRRYVAEVHGASMAPALCGPGFSVRCSTCLFEFRVGGTTAKDGSAPRPCQCPECGSSIDIPDQRVHPGDSVVVQRLGLFEQPRRWQIVAARDPRDSTALLVKRVVGLPGEGIRICAGDIFVNNRRLKKTLSEFRTMATLVHDSRYHGDARTPTAWQTLLAKTNWARTNGIWRRVCLAPEMAVEVPCFSDGLVFVPPSHFPGAAAIPPRITDYNCFDQANSRVLNTTHDVLLSATIQADHGDAWTIHADDGWHRWRISFGVPTSLVRIYRDERLVCHESDAFETSARRHAIQLALCDGRLLLSVDSRPALQADSIPSNPRRIPEFPFSLTVESGTSLTIDSLIVYRDVYYTSKGSTIDATWTLADDEYFLLGDYSPLSIDSRDPEIGPVQDADILGVVDTNQTI